MSFDYGYGELNNKLVTLFRSWPPDFAAAEKLIAQGADLNATGNDADENMLSEILWAYWNAAFGESADTDFDHYPCSDSQLGPSMCEIICFFLDHGFDVTKQEGCYGAQCLYALTLSVFDRHILEAAKMLLDAGAQNRPITSLPEDVDETPMSYASTEACYMEAVNNDYALSNIYEALYQIYLALQDGRPYSGIDSYEIAVGKKILRVLAEGTDPAAIFYPLNLAEFQKENCFTQTLYFVYEGGVLVTTKYADVWTDTILPETDLVDISARFIGIVGSSIDQFTFANKSIVRDSTRCSQPIITLDMSSGQKIRFSINFGEVDEADRAAYYELIP